MGTVEQTHRFVVYRDKNKQFRWKKIARNGRKTGGPGEGFKRRASAFDSLTREIMAGPVIVEDTTRKPTIITKFVMGQKFSFI